MVEELKGFGGILNSQIKFHPVVILGLKTEISVFDESVPAVFVKAEQSDIPQPVTV